MRRPGGAPRRRCTGDSKRSDHCHCFTEGWPAAPVHSADTKRPLGRTGRRSGRGAGERLARHVATVEPIPPGGGRTSTSDPCPPLPTHALIEQPSRLSASPPAAAFDLNLSRVVGSARADAARVPPVATAEVPERKYLRLHLFPGAVTRPSTDGHHPNHSHPVVDQCSATASPLSQRRERRGVGGGLLPRGRSPEGSSPRRAGTRRFAADTVADFTVRPSAQLVVPCSPSASSCSPVSCSRSAATGRTGPHWDIGS